MNLFIVFIAVTTPLISLRLIREIKKGSVLIMFLLFCLTSVLAGLTINALISKNAYLIGISQVSGIKLQLLLPLLLAPLVLLNFEEFRSIWNSPLLIKHVGWGLIALIGFAGIYLMRSGNFPLIPVLDAERYFRDALESLFGARPRFKEFMIGHPLLCLGLFQYYRAQTKKTRSFLNDGRLFMSLGIVGQISIINTFVHIHTPLHLGVLRTFHSMWMGFILAVILWKILPRRFK